jgi:dGTPase
MQRDALLAPYAMKESASQGRRYPEPDHPYRGLFQRDRDRILHAAAFRRLTAKTQVLVAGTNDHHRTRLTHTLEVAQVSRTIARELALHEDLTEAIALVHDLGHPPFGHAGESALDSCLKEHGGFEHNRHGLRIVEILEQRYPAFPGLNLTWEVRESLAFHSQRTDAADIQEYRRGIRQPTLEAQVVDAADSLVYDIHDLEDAYGVGLITLDDLRRLTFWRGWEKEMLEKHGALPAERFLPAILRRLLAYREQALLESSRQRLKESKVKDAADVKAWPQPLVQESDSINELIEEVRGFLNEHVYHHARVLRMSRRGKRSVCDLFQAYSAEPKLMPKAHAQRAELIGAQLAAADYIAGMTDRLATLKHRKLFQSR